MFLNQFLNFKRIKKKLLLVYYIIIIIIEINTGLLRNLIHEAFRKSTLHYR